MRKVSIKPLVLSAALAASLTAGVAPIIAEQTDGIVLREVSSQASDYCHIKYMAITKDSLRSNDPQFNPNDIIDRYGSCDFNPKSRDEIRQQLSVLPKLEGLEDSE
jgi:hypothetical protein